MDQTISLEQTREKIKDMLEIAQQLINESSNFPAVNRNTKRLLASLEMLRINLEEA
ncbi:MAG: hypothetical protein ACP5VS_14860 [Desulfomonilaceae bacterium]